MCWLKPALFVFHCFVFLVFILSFTTESEREDVRYPLFQWGAAALTPGTSDDVMCLIAVKCATDGRALETCLLHVLP